MKRLLASLLAAFRATPVSRAAPNVESIDIKSIRYSMPTVAADSIEFVMPTEESFQGAPQFHEDEWGQLEFFPKTRLTEVQTILSNFKTFEKDHRTQYGWNEIFARRIPRTAVLPRDVSAQQLGMSAAERLLPAPILATTSHPLGQVKEGFSIKLGENAYLYGQTNRDGITILGAHLAGADDMLLTRAFTTLNRRYSVILVDWLQQLVLVSVAENGDIDVWRP